MTRHLLAFNGSPRKGGNTEVLLAALIEAARAGGAQVEVFRLNDLHFRPCQNCGGCDKTGKCILRDDLSPLYEKILGASAIVIASPIYFYGVSAQTKAFIDRMQAFWNRKEILKKKGQWLDDPTRTGHFLSVAATKGAKTFDGAILTVRYAYDAMGFHYGEELLVRGIDRKGEIIGATAALEAAQRLGTAIALTIGHT